MNLRLAVVQLSAEKGALDHNLDRIAEATTQAAEQKADLVLFPEAVVSGYFLEGGVAECALPPEDLALRLNQRYSGPDTEVVVGFYEKTESRPYNSVAHLVRRDGEFRVRSVYRKFFPPTYGVFDEARFHAHGRELGVFETQKGRVGVLICEDMWHSLLRSLLALQGCQVILIPAATPARGFATEAPANIERYERMLVSCSEENGVFTALSCLTGMEGNRMMAGGSMVVDPFGRKISAASNLNDEILLVPLELEDVERAQRQTPLPQDLRMRWADIQRLVARDQ